MTKVESLQDIKESAVKLQEILMRSDIELIRMAEEAWHQLVNRFYQEAWFPWKDNGVLP